MRTEPDTYEFVARKSDVDYQRIIDEAPDSTDIIVVEERERNGRPTQAVVLLNARLALDPRVQNKIVAGASVAEWINEEDDFAEEHREFSFIPLVLDTPKLPGFVKRQIANIQRALNPSPKNRKVKVSLY